MKIVLIILSSLIISGCVTNTPDVLFSEPVGKPLNTGNYPVIGRVPKAQTAQITPTERTAAKAELARAAQKGSAQAAQDSQSAYNRELAAMRKLAASEKKKRLAEIESRKF